MKESGTSWHSTRRARPGVCFWRESARATARGLVLSVLLAACAGAVGCTGKDEVKALVVDVSDDQGGALNEFVALVGEAEGTVETSICPSAPAPQVECQSGGLRIDGAQGSLSLTVKARGHGFVSRTIEVGALDEEDGVATVHVTLPRLPPFTANEDYRTGFDTENAPAAFAELAVPMATELGPTEVVKFYVAHLDGTPEVYFQNTMRHPLHYGFAREVLGVSQGLGEFEAATYHGEDRTGFAGTLTRYPNVEAESAALGARMRAPVTLSFFPSDDLTPEQALHCHRLLEERLGNVALSGPKERLAYVPAGDVTERALVGRTDAYARAGAAWLTQNELYGGLSEQYLNDGVAYGTLRRMSPEELARSIVSYTDILVLTRLPNELPVVGGTITEELQTPLAHVNVAARARGTPNLALLGAGEHPRVAPLLGKLVRFEVKRGTFTVTEATLADAQAFWASRSPEPLAPSFDAERSGLPGFHEIGFADSISVGAKAANLAELHQLLPAEAPDGFAVPFRYYDEHLTNSAVTADSCARASTHCLAEGRSAALCDAAEALCTAGTDGDMLWAYATRLTTSADLAADSALREAALASLRYHIETAPLEPGFAALLDARVGEVFGTAQVRLRSSTNTEDLPNFSGAGLYRSVSASGSKGLPSERIRLVWASVWGFQAFEERAYWNIDHLAVKMGIAVNPAFDDEIANGVLITQNIGDPTVAGMYVNVQLGETSVTNPTDGALPEVFAIIPSPTGIQVARQRYSSLSPESPILADDEVRKLFQAATSVQNHFAALYEQSAHTLAMDLEFKLAAPDRRLVIKQARPYVR